jgi:adenylate cyclase
MSKRRAKIFEAKYFSLFIGFAIVFVVFLISSLTFIFKGLELKVLDTHLYFNSFFSQRVAQEGVSVEAQNPKQSEDIIILGIDNKTLADFGKYPFPRYHYADLLNAFSRIKSQELRERSILLDVFFVEPDDNATDDALLVDALGESQRVFMETINSQFLSPELDEEEN